MLQGSLVALVTPMTADNQIDWPALHKLVEWHIEQGTHAIVAVGTTGESPTLNWDREHSAVIRAVVDQVNGRIPVIAGTGGNSTSEAVEWTAAAKEMGADACLLVAPYYNKPSQEGLFRHFEYVARSVAIPQLLYNVPGRTVSDIQHETVMRLTQVDNIIGIKEATGDLARARRLIEETPDDFLVISGDDATALELILLGGKGNVSVTANVAPARVAKVCEQGLAGDAEGARELNETLAPLNKALFLESNPIPVKWALQQMGLIGPGIRLPLTPLAEQYHGQVLAAMESAGISAPGH